MTDTSKIAQLFRTAAEDLVKIKPEEWRETFSDVHGEDLRLISNSLIQLAVVAARMSAYIDARGGEGGTDKGHIEAVRNQNECAEKIRSVLGFQHPKANIEF
ncbi:MAG: hypothetical protein QOJ64_2304 [Acidobacteriota bacterium]|jgi:hypothetical protein|nr:hypothetical protein [Acidobacteriota bacterium]